MNNTLLTMAIINSTTITTLFSLLSIAQAFTLTMMSSSSTKTSTIRKPALPLPPPLTSTAPGTWAYDTMTRRIRSEILRRTVDENKSQFESDQFESMGVGRRLEELGDELRNAASTPLRHLRPLDTADDDGGVRQQEMEEWFQILKPFIDDKLSDGKDVDTWLTCPWMVAEFYFYRRLLEATRYFDDSIGSKGAGTFKYDPFLIQKREGLYSSVDAARPILKQMEDIILKSKDGDNREEGMGLAVAFALWGNKMDLSLWPADSKGENAPGMFQSILSNAADNLLKDDTEELVKYGMDLYERARRVHYDDDDDDGDGSDKEVRVDIIVDNAGFELIMDIILADYLITSGIANVVRFQLKAHPTFVSDAMESDLMEHIDYYATMSSDDDDDDEEDPCVEAGKRWNTYLQSGKFQCHEDNFWVQPPPMWEMPTPLRSELNSNCDLAFVKGDANYRRILGDLHWDYSKDGFEEVVGAYFPCPVCALRTLKAEVGCGMEEGKVKRAMELDDSWNVNGRFGVVQFSMGNSGDD